MKETNNGSLYLTEQKEASYASEYAQLKDMVSRLCTLREEFGTMAFSPQFMDGIFREQFFDAWTRIDDVLSTDIAQPLSVCVIENEIMHKSAVV